MTSVCSLGTHINRKLCTFLLCGGHGDDVATRSVALGGMDGGDVLATNGDDFDSDGVDVTVPSFPPLQRLGAVNVRGANMVSGMAVVGDNMYISHYCDSQLWVYSVTRNQLLKKLDIKGMTAPVGMALVSAGSDSDCGDDVARTKTRLAISDCNERQLHLVTVSAIDNVIVSLETHQLSYTPASLSVHPAGHLVIANPDSNQVMLHDADNGHVLTSVQLSSDVESLRHVVATGDGNYAVIDYDGNSVVWADGRGKVLRRYGNQPGEDLSDPKFALDDGQKGLIVCDTWNHRLHLITGNTEPVGHLATDLCIPSCMFLDQTNGTLFVAHGDRNAAEVVIYDFHGNYSDWIIYD